MKELEKKDAPAVSGGNLGGPDFSAPPEGIVTPILPSVPEFPQNPAGPVIPRQLV